MPIQLRPSTQALNVHSKGTAVPAWFGDYANKTKWDNDGVPASGPTNGFYHQVTTSATDVHTYLQYGQNTTGWAAARFFDQDVKVTSQTENANGSIHVVGNVTVGPIAAYKTDFFVGGVSVTFKVTVNGRVIHNHSGLTGDEYLELPTPTTIPFDVTVPTQTESDVTTVKLDWTYPNHEYPDSHFVLGTALYNPNVPNYVPMAIRKSGSYKSLNTNNGFIRVRKSGAWVDKGEENLSTSKQPNSGHNRIRRGGTYLQLPPM